MGSEASRRIRANPKFRQLVRRRARLAWTLTIVVAVTFYGFVLAVAFAPGLIARPVASGSALSVGVACAGGMFVAFWLLTVAYVRLANRELDALAADVIEEASRPEGAPKPLVGLVLLASPVLARAEPALAEAIAPRRPSSAPAIAMFLAFVALTLGITYWASRRTRTASDFYAAHHGLSGLQNGLAMAGDYMSAGALLGLTALTYSQGFDGYMYLIAFYVGWPLILFLIAEPLRNLGRFTLADVISYRFEQRAVRTMAAISSLTVVSFYLVAQMVGAGQLVRLLFGLPFSVAVVAVGTLMTIYVMFGGMIATTWVQIVKACLLLLGGTLVTLLAMSRFGFSYASLVERATAAHALGRRLLAPGPLLSDPVNAISLGMGLMFGTAGLPHVLMRFFTVTDAREARKSVLYASALVGYFFNLIFLMGLSAIVIVGQDGAFFEGGRPGATILGGGNMVAMHLARAVGGDLLLGFQSAVAFATILAVVSGLALAGASAISHDLYATVMKQGKAAEAAELRVSRLATVGVAAAAVGAAMLFESQNVAYLIGLTFGVAAAANFPILILSIYWRRLTTRGALAGGYSGLVSSVLLVVLSRPVWVTVLGHARPLFPYDQPALFAMPGAFLVATLVSLLDRSTRAAAEAAAFDEQYVRAQTGLGALAAGKR
jgi:cation/acetate symporter